jgi:cytochrome c biogenesis protein CcdA
MENECFGLPNGGMIVGIVFGIIILLVGLGLFLQATGVTVDFWQFIWPFILIIFGILILLGALYRQRRYSQRPSNPPP